MSEKNSLQLFKNIVVEREKVREKAGIEKKENSKFEESRVSMWFDGVQRANELMKDTSYSSSLKKKSRFDALEREAQSVDAYINRLDNSSNKNKLRKTFNAYKKFLDDNKTGANLFTEFASQFDNEDDYNSALNEIQIAQKYSNLKTYDDYISAMEGLIESDYDDTKYYQAEKRWLENKALETGNNKELQKRFDYLGSRIDNLKTNQDNYVGSEAGKAEYSEHIIGLQDDAKREMEAIENRIAYNNAEKEKADNLKKFDYITKIPDYDTKDWADVEYADDRFFNIDVDGSRVPALPQLDPNNADDIYCYLNTTYTGENGPYSKNELWYGQLEGRNINGVLVGEGVKYSYITEEEKQKFNAIYTTEGDKRALEYIKVLEPYLDERQEEYVKTETTNTAKENPVLSWINTRANKVLYPAVTLGNIIDTIDKSDTYDNSSLNYLVSSDETVDQTIKDEYASNWFGGAEIPVLNRTIGETVYDVGTGVADQAIRMAVAKGMGGSLGAESNINGFLMGSEAASTSFVDAKERGASDEQALVYGLVSGIIEGVTEKYSIEALYNKPKNIFSKIKNPFIRSVIAEGSEEMAAEALNNIADVIINADKAQFNLTMQEYMDKGMTQNQAFAQTVVDVGGDTLYSGLIGSLTGGAFGGASAIGQSIQNNSIGKSVQNYDNVDALISIAKEPKYYGTKAQKLATQLENGKVTNSKVAELRAEIMKVSVQDSKQALEQGYTPDIIESELNYEIASQSVNKTFAKKQTSNTAPKTKTVSNETVAPKENNNTAINKDFVTVKNANDMEPQDALQKFVTANKMNENTAKVFKENYDGTMDIEEYAREFVYYNNQGELIRNYNTIPHNISSLSETARLNAYEAGLKTGTEYLRVKNALTKEQQANVGYNNGKIDTTALKGVTLNEYQKSTVDYLKSVAEASGINIKVVASSANDYGEYTDPNASYNSTRHQITIDVNAGRQTISDAIVTGAMHSALYHELTHISERATDEYIELRQAVEQAVGNESWTVAVEKQKRVLKNTKQRAKEVAKMTEQQLEEEASKEALAEFCSGLYKNTDILEKIVDDNPSVAKKIITTIKNIITKLKNMLKNNSHLSKEAKELLDNLHKAEDIIGKYERAVLQGIKNQNAKQSSNINDNRSTVNEKQQKNNTDSKADVQHSFAGRKAVNNNQSLLEKAQYMIENGVDSETVRKETGWFKGLDNDWRFEINDSKMEVATNGKFARDPQIRRYTELLDKVYFKNDYTQTEFKELQELDKKFENTSVEPKYLGDLIQHDELFKAYPQLKEISVIFEKISGNTLGAYHSGFKEIVLSRSLKLKPEQLKKTLIHEIQHAIQDIEGFASGASVEYWKNYRQDIVDTLSGARANLDLWLDDIGYNEFVKKSMQEVVNKEKTLEEHWNDCQKFKNNSKYAKQIANCEAEIAEFQKQYNEITNGMTVSEQYLNTAGEIEARDTENRLRLSESERKNIRPDIDRTDVVFADNTESSYSVNEKQQKNNTTTESGVQYSINDRFIKQLENWDKNTIGFSFILGNTSDKLLESGVPNKQIRWDASKIKTLLNKHNGMSIDVIKKIPELLENPIVVIDSKQNVNSRIVMGDLYDNNGKIITVAMLLTPTSKKGNQLSVIKISSAQGRSHIESLFKKADGTNITIRYVDEKRIQSWLNVNRLQLPLHSFNLDSNDKIPQSTNFVNTKNMQDDENNTIQNSSRVKNDDIGSGISQAQIEDHLQFQNREADYSDEAILKRADENAFFEFGYDDLDFNLSQEEIEEAELRQMLGKNPTEALRRVFNMLAKTSVEGIKSGVTIDLDKTQVKKLVKKVLIEYQVNPYIKKESYVDDFVDDTMTLVEKIKNNEGDPDTLFNNYITGCRVLLSQKSVVENSDINQKRKDLKNALKGYQVIPDYALGDVISNYGSFENYRKLMFKHGIYVMTEGKGKTKGLTPTDLSQLGEELYRDLGDDIFLDNSDYGKQQGYELPTWDSISGWMVIEKLLNEKYAPVTEDYFGNSKFGTQNVNVASVELAFHTLAEYIRTQALESTKTEPTKTIKRLRDSNNKMQKKLTSMTNVVMNIVNSDKQFKEYKETAESLEKNFAKLSDVNDKISLENTPSQLANLKQEKANLEKLVSSQMKRMETLRESKAVKSVVEVERRKILDANMRAYNRESKEAVLYIDKIKKISNKLNQMLLRPTKTSFVPQEAVKACSELCALLTDKINLQNGSKVSQKLGVIKDKLISLNAQSDYVDYNGIFDNYFFDDIKELQTYLKENDIKSQRKTANNSGLTLKELIYIHSTLSRIQHTISTANKQIGINENKTNKESSIKMLQELSKVKGSQGVIRQYEYSTLNPYRIALIHSNFNRDSELMHHLDEINRGVRLAKKYEMEWKKPFEKLIDENRKGLAKALKTIHTVNFKNNLGEVQTVKITPMQSIQVLLSWKREQSNENLLHLKHGGINLSNPEYLVKGEYKKAITQKIKVGSINENLIEQLENKLTDFDKKYMKLLDDYFNNISKSAINKTSRAIEGRNLATERSYFPITVDPDHLPNSVKENSEIKARSPENSGRLAPLIEKAPQPLIIEGANIVLDRHISEMSAYCGKAIPLRNFRKAFNYKDKEPRAIENLKSVKILSDVSVGAFIKSKWGENGENVYTQLMDDLVAKRKLPDKNQTFNKLLNTWRSNRISSIFSGNVSVALKNLSAYLAAGKYLSNASLTTSAVKGAKIIKNWEEFCNEIDTYTASHYVRRKGLTSNDMKDFFNTKLGDFYNKTGLNKWIAAADSYVTALHWEACKSDIKSQYKKANKEIGTQEYWQEVTDLYDKVIEQTQQNADVLHQPEVFKTTSEIVRNFVMFKSEPFQHTGALTEAVLEFKAKRNKETAKVLGKTVSAMVGSNVLLMALSAFGALLLYKPYRDENEEVTVEVFLTEMFKIFCESTAELIEPLFLGKLVYNIANYALTEEKPFEIRSITEQMINEVMSIEIVEDISNAKSLGDMVKVGYEALKIGLSNFKGAPIQNGENVITAISYYITDIINGELGSYQQGVNQTPTQKVRSYGNLYLKGETEKAKEKLDELYKAKYDEQIAKGESPTEAYKNARGSVRESLSNAYKEDYQEAYKNNDQKKMQDISNLLYNSGYMVWLTNKTLSDHLSEWRKSANK